MNVIGSRPDRWWKDPDRAVRRLIEQLDRYAAATGEQVTVVFDRQPADVAAGAHGAVVVVFPSRRGRDAADHEIVRLVARMMRRELCTRPRLAGGARGYSERSFRCGGQWCRQRI